MSEEEPPFESNSLRYWLRYSPRSIPCKKCKETINSGSVRFGASQEDVVYGTFFWYHPECISGRQCQNVCDTYFDGNLEDVDYDRIPGFIELREENQAHVRKCLSTAINRQIKHGITHATPIEDLDWRELLREGHLEDEKKDFLKEILQFVGLKRSGKQAELVDRLRQHVAMENNAVETSRSNANASDPTVMNGNSSVPPSTSSSSSSTDSVLKVYVPDTKVSQSSVKANVDDGKVKASKASRNPAKREYAMERPRRRGSDRSYV